MTLVSGTSSFRLESCETYLVKRLANANIMLVAISYIGYRVDATSHSFVEVEDYKSL